MKKKKSSEYTRGFLAGLAAGTEAIDHTLIDLNELYSDSIHQQIAAEIAGAFTKGIKNAATIIKMLAEI